MGTTGYTHAFTAAVPTAKSEDTTVETLDASMDGQAPHQGANEFDVVLDCYVGTGGAREHGGLPREAVRAIWSSTFDAAPYVVRDACLSVIAAADRLVTLQGRRFL